LPLFNRDSNVLLLRTKKPTFQKILTYKRSSKSGESTDFWDL